MTRVAVIDPLTLLGRELLQLLPRYPELARDPVWLHTADDEEHQIAELEGRPALVPPLVDPIDLEDCDAVLSLTSADTPRLDALEAFLDAHPDVPFVDAGRLERFWDRLHPLVGPPLERPQNGVRVAHPSLVAATAIVEPIDDLDVTGVTVAAVEPVSALGREQVERLAHQATARLNGAPVEEDIAGHVLAFTAVDLPAELLVEDLARLLGGLPAAVCRTLTGTFHGHRAHIGLHFSEPVTHDDLEERWRANPLLERSDAPLSLDDVADRESVLVGLPHLSPDGTAVAVTTMVDGLRIGGAFTALEILQSFF